MLDPRIYRMALVPVVLAVIVLAFSLENQQGGVGTTLAPDAYSGQNAYSTMNGLARKYPARQPGSPDDNHLADSIAQALVADRFQVSRDLFSARTVSGTRVLENVVGSRAGLVPGTIAIVTHRDSAELSGTGVLLELARLLGGQTQHHTIVLASITGSVGAVGAARLARELPQPVDAVVVLGDLAGRNLREPIVVPWSSGQLVAPTMLRNTVAGELGAQAGLSTPGNSLGGQIAHLAFPMTSAEQAPFGSSGEPSVLISVSSDHRAAAGERTTLARIGGMGRAVLQTLGALDNAPSVPAPSTYLLWSGKVVPEWAVTLLVLALIAPVAAATIDGVARARRRRIPVVRWVAWVLSAAAPFAGAAVLVGLARAVGLIGFAPGIATGAGAVPIGGSGAVVLVALACVIVGGLLLLAPALTAVAGVKRADVSEADPNAGAGIALLAVLCVIAFLVWLANPFAAILIVPGLHLWMWVFQAKRRLPAPALAVLLLGGLALPALAALYYALTLGLGPVGVAWSWVLLLAGGAVGWLTALEWSVFAGCAISVAVIALRVARAPAPEPTPITIRGPVTYAGPGSLGGTSSAMRR